MPHACADRVQLLRREELRKQAEVLAEERRKARVELEELTSRLQDESEEERERKAAKKRAREQAAAATGEDGAEAGSQKKRKRTTKKRMRRGRGDADADDDEGVRLPSEDEDDAMFSAPEDRGDDAPAKVCCLFFENHARELNRLLSAYLRSVW